MTLPAIEVAKKDPRIAPVFRIFYHLVTQELDPVEWKEIKVAPIGRALQCSADTVERALTLLIQTGYVQCQPRLRVGELARYRFKYAPDTPASMRMDRAS